MRRSLWGLGMAAALCCPLSVRAQQPPAGDPTQVIRDAQDTADDLFISRVFAVIKLSPSQAGRLAPVLEQAQAKMKEVEDREAASVARLRAAAEDARKRALAGAAPAATLDQQYTTAVQNSATLRENTRTTQVTLIRARLASILSPDQMAALQEQAQLAARQREQDDLLNQFANGERGGGPIEFSGRALDRMREIPQDQWDAMRQRMTRGPGGRGGFGPPGGRGFGGPGGPGGGPGGPGGPGGGRRGGPGGGGADDPVAAARRQQAEARGQQMQAFMERVRTMSPEEYAASRSQLALQYFDQQRGGRVRGSADSQLNDFISDYLLRPTAVRAARRRAGLGE